MASQSQGLLSILRTSWDSLSCADLPASEPPAVEPSDSLGSSIDICKEDVDLSITALGVNVASRHGTVLALAFGLDIF